MLLQILSHTPAWVFGLFAFLLWLGARQLRASSSSLTRVAVMPIAMGGLAIYGMLSAFGDSPLALLTWALAAVALFVWIQRRPTPATTRYDAATRTFHAAGSAIPLVLMMGIFLTKYVVAVAFTMHPEWAHQAPVALAVSSLYGVFSGSFAGRAFRLLKLARRTDGALPSAA